MKSNTMFVYHIGKYCLLLNKTFRKPEKNDVYWRETVHEMDAIGIGSLGIVSIISIFIGAVATIQTAFQLVSDLIPRSIIGSITRDTTALEFAPTITALVLAGRIGSSIASQIGTMRATEQIDALEVMGVNAPGYLIMPKIIAGVTMFPLLVTISVALGILGGYIAGDLSGVVPKADYIMGLTTSFNPLIVKVFLTKATIFAFIITSVSAYQGFYVSGGTQAVGHASTQAVVISCIVILVADYAIVEFLL